MGSACWARSDRQLCRRSWNRIPGSPARFRSGVKVGGHEVIILLLGARLEHKGECGKRGFSRQGVRPYVGYTWVQKIARARRARKAHPRRE